MSAPPIRPAATPAPTAQPTQRASAGAGATIAAMPRTDAATTAVRALFIGIPRDGGEQTGRKESRNPPVGGADYPVQFVGYLFEFWRVNSLNARSAVHTARRHRASARWRLVSDQ